MSSIASVLLNWERIVGAHIQSITTDHIHNMYKIAGENMDIPI